MPQRRRRTYMFAFHKDSAIAKTLDSPEKWLYSDGILAAAFPIKDCVTNQAFVTIDGSLGEVSESFNKGKNTSPFKNAGVMADRQVFTATATPSYHNPPVTLGDILVDESDVPAEFFIPEDDVKKWAYAKGGKSEKRVNKTTGYEYNYSEGAMAFPDYLDKPSRTIITGEGGAAPSRFKHVVLTPSGRYRRLIPLELERLNMFPDNHTAGVSDTRRAFLMGNALVTGIVERIGYQLLKRSL